MKKHSAKGFTLIEFIVIISIFAIMASVAMFNFNGFRSNVSLNNLAHDIGLTIRQAQVFGWSNKSDGGAAGIALSGTDIENGNPLRYAEGVYFDDPHTLQGQKEFILYKKNVAVVSQNYASGSDTVIDTIKVSGPNKIGKLAYAQTKADLTLNTNHQISGGSVNEITALSIAFTRPKPEASFFMQGGLELNHGYGDYVGIYIQGDADPVDYFSHVIIISRTGEIDVQ